MKFNSALLLVGVTLLAAMPASADSYASRPAVGSEKYQLIATPRADFALDGSKNEALRTELFSGDAFSSASSNSDDVRSLNFMKLDSYRGGTGEGSTAGGQSDGSIPVVPEPESASLVLLGLVAIGSMALRRR
jgi:hypothetical protein